MPSPVQIVSALAEDFFITYVSFCMLLESMLDDVRSATGTFICIVNGQIFAYKILLSDYCTAKRFLQYNAYCFYIMVRIMIFCSKLYHSTCDFFSLYYDRCTWKSFKRHGQRWDRNLWKRRTKNELRLAVDLVVT